LEVAGELENNHVWCGGQSLKSIEISNILEAMVNVNGIKFVPSHVLNCQQAGSLPSQLEVFSWLL
jgi:hypothetical protein